MRWRLFVPFGLVGCLASIEALRPEAQGVADGGIPDTGALMPDAGTGPEDASAKGDAAKDANGGQDAMADAGSFCLSQTDSPVFCNDFDRGEGPPNFSLGIPTDIDGGAFSLRPSLPGQGNALHFSNVGYSTAGNPLTRFVNGFGGNPTKITLRASIRCDIDTSFLFVTAGGYGFQLWATATDGLEVIRFWPYYAYTPDGVNAVNQWIQVEFVMDFGAARKWTLKRNGVMALSNDIPLFDDAGASAPGTANPSLAVGPLYLDKNVTCEWDNISLVLQ